MDIVSLRDKILARKQQMENDRESFEDTWTDIAKYVAPRSLRWLDDDPKDRGSKKIKDIIDPTTTLACRNFVSGSMSGMLNPSRKNWVYGTQNPNFTDDVEVRSYLATCEDIDRNIVLQSNFYMEAAKFIRQSALFGTAAMYIEEDDESVVRYETYPAGTYFIGMSSRRVVNEFMRVYNDTATNLVRDFGEENCSLAVVTAAKDKSSSNTRFDVIHYIGPNDEYCPAYELSWKGKKFISVYMEVGPAGYAATGSRDYTYNDVNNKILRRGGYSEFPVAVHRWQADGMDTYGSEYPGLVALGHTKELQKVRKLMAQGLELQMKPPMQASLNSRNQQLQMLPGFFNFVDQTTGGAKPLIDVRPDLQSGAQYMADIRARIENIFFNDVFLMIANERRSGTKAREIEELAQERMMQLSPILETFTDEFLDPAISRTFNIIERRGLHPIPPSSFEGQRFDIEYINILSTTLKMQGIAALDRGLAVIGQVGSAKPEALDIINTDRFLENYLKRLDFDPRALSTDEEIEAIRESRRAYAAQQDAMQQAQMSAETAKTLSETKTQEDNALTQIINMARGA